MWKENAPISICRKLSIRTPTDAPSIGPPTIFDHKKRWCGLNETEILSKFLTLHREESVASEHDQYPSNLYIYKYTDVTNYV